MILQLLANFFLLFLKTKNRENTIKNGFNFDNLHKCYITKKYDTLVYKASENMKWPRSTKMQ
jgi:hypothetical protein